MGSLCVGSNYLRLPQLKAYSTLQRLLKCFCTGKLNSLKKLEDCHLVADHATELCLTTESCANLLAYCWQREADASNGSKGDGKGEKCNIM